MRGSFKGFGVFFLCCALLFLGVGIAKAEVVDVVVVGGGPAGLAAAIEAASTGARVILLEKTGMLGGALRYTTGTISGAGTSIQKAQGIVDSPELHFLDSMVEGDFKADPELLMLYCTLAGPTIDWLVEELGVLITEAVFAPEHTLYSVPRSYKPRPVNGVAAVLDGMLKKVEQYDNLTIHLNTEGMKLIQDELTHRVIGVMAVHEGRVHNFYGRHGVILATGGFGNNQRMLERYVSGSENWFMVAAAGATGDGHRMAREVGAKLTHMEYVPTYNYGFERANGQVALVYVRSELFGGIYVNEQAERFVNELAPQKEREYALRKQPNSVMFEVFDEAIRLANNRPHINAFCESGEILSGNTLDELAQKMGVDPMVFVKTIEEYNRYAKNGEDLAFGKSPISVELASPPYYAARLRPLGLLTLGGVEVDLTMNARSTEGEAILGLYAAGELLGGVHGTHISSGNGITAPMAFGRLAGRSVLTTEPFLIFASSVEVTDLVLADGEFIGTAQGYGGTITLRILVQGGKIRDLEVVSHEETPAIATPAFQTMKQRVLEQGSLQVDTVSGATLTSRGFLQAIQNAFEQK